MKILIIKSNKRIDKFCNIDLETLKRETEDDTRRLKLPLCSYVY